ncbi:MAG: recombination mediator RecR [Candidatus Omnitrophica bacterium]|nr:recombination mediator RecR [Candidatus Omnitrophota bacterium]
MPSLPESITCLIAELGKWPGIGPRSAERLALYLVQSEPEAVRQLAKAIVSARDRIQSCSVCGALTERQPCAICEDTHRDRSLICVVERPVDIISIEKSGAYHGLYHVLGGKISPVNGVGPEDLRIAALEQRLASAPNAEIIIALGSDVDGDATSFYLARRLAPFKVKLSRLAHGLPVGSSLEFADELTLSQAIEGRRTMS